MISSSIFPSSPGPSTKLLPHAKEQREPDEDDQPREEELPLQLSLSTFHFVAALYFPLFPSFPLPLPSNIPVPSNDWSSPQPSTFPDSFHFAPSRSTGREYLTDRLIECPLVLLMHQSTCPEYTISETRYVATAVLGRLDRLDRLETPIAQLKNRREVGDTSIEILPGQTPPRPATDTLPTAGSFQSCSWSGQVLAPSSQIGC
ncbi:hypothetical protein B0T20DRAFT_146240 [Sordaria brevicollis]|uniref:Uncharacterized protein n=1 Tax=Sordaria brevicollis TaxID=83679 RepID=A0AAE0PIB4_SORBR|nr:hypothetical protein B0T20DRAFT_146240 [Sordaria brevicollis]